MMCAARLAQRMGRVDEAFVRRQQELLDALQLPTSIPEYDSDEIITLMHHDKKADGGQLRFVLPTKMGHVELVNDARVDDVRASLSQK